MKKPGAEPGLKCRYMFLNQKHVIPTLEFEGLLIRMVWRAQYSQGAHGSMTTFMVTPWVRFQRVVCSLLGAHSVLSAIYIFAFDF